jgi:RNA polymerase sigma-70 factor (ECF subfamily)
MVQRPDEGPCESPPTEARDALSQEVIRLNREAFASEGYLQELGAVWAQCEPRVRNLARRMLDNEADADDLTQDVAMQLCRKIQQYRGQSAFTTWVHRVTVNAALAHRQKRSKRAAREASLPDTEGEHEPPEEDDEPLAAMEQAELHDAIDVAIGHLKDGYREVFLLADVEQLSNDEVARLLHLSVPAVKSRLHRARGRIRTELIARHLIEA